MNVLDKWLTGRVARWHAWHTVSAQTVADHSWGVMVVLLEILPKDHPEYVDILKAALYHDAYEYFTGDIPYQAKREFPSLRAAEQTAVEKLNERHKLLPTLSPLAEGFVKWADMFELWLFSEHQVMQGNRYYVRVCDTAKKVLFDTYPSPEALQLLMRLKEDVG